MEAGEVGMIKNESGNTDDAGYHDCIEDKKETDFRVSLMIRTSWEAQSRAIMIFMITMR